MDSESYECSICGNESLCDDIVWNKINKMWQYGVDECNQCGELICHNCMFFCNSCDKTFCIDCQLPTNDDDWVTCFDCTNAMEENQ